MAQERNVRHNQVSEQVSNQVSEVNQAGYREPTEQLRERYQELIDELRVVLPGVQVLFAFLITAPFSGRFSELDDVQEGAYSIALVASTIALVLLLTPVAYHRLGCRQDRADRIAVAVRLKLGGLAFLGVSMTAAMLAVVGFVYSNTVGLIAAGLLAAGALIAWVALPLIRTSTDTHFNADI